MQAAFQFVLSTLVVKGCLGLPIVALISDSCISPRVGLVWEIFPVLAQGWANMGKFLYKPKFGLVWEISLSEHRIFFNVGGNVGW